VVIVVRCLAHLAHTTSWDDKWLRSFVRERFSHGTQSQFRLVRRHSLNGAPRDIAKIGKWSA